MKDDMQKEAAFEKNNVKKDVAEYIKKEFDKKYGPTWHCIVGSNFGPNKTLLRSLGHRHFSDLTGTKTKRNYANNVSEYNTVLASLNAKRSKGNRRYDVIECDPLVRKGLEITGMYSRSYLCTVYSLMNFVILWQVHWHLLLMRV
ncbi:hypothetical protein ES332_A09G162400v1 [Gossypium tomentosum]|uniref:Dynein light chain n=1 Tax=Gossypium tomentosum TaxID=34277 RepID=A0A5D2P325_GOSTO|nr:hypothetical protein ES332_A09G162400v1 [Gossypium tomentosum]